MEIKTDKRDHVGYITEQQLELCLADLRLGVPIKYATESNGINEGHFHSMIRQGMMDWTEKKDTLNARLAKSLRVIQKDFVMRHMTKILESEKGHKGAEWTLERLYWRVFSKSAEVLDLQQQIDDLKSTQHGALENVKEIKELDSKRN